jgi:hypothetical protein
MGMVTSAIIGDSVVDRFRDTLRLVRLMFDAPNAGVSRWWVTSTAGHSDATQCSAMRRRAVGGDAGAQGWRASLRHRRRQHATSGLLQCARAELKAGPSLRLGATISNTTHTGSLVRYTFSRRLDAGT